MQWEVRVQLVRSAGFELGVTALERAGSGRSDFRVLTYHRVTDLAEDRRHPGLISAAPAEFRAQIDFIVRRWNPVSVHDVIQAVNGGLALPRHAVLLTFDDGCDDFVEHVWPILQEYEVPAVVFVPTAFVDRADAFFWWDAVYAATIAATGLTLETPLGPSPVTDDAARVDIFRSLRSYCKTLGPTAAEAVGRSLCEQVGVTPPPAGVMSWATLGEIQDEGLVAVCAHTRRHAHLDQVSTEDARAEIAGSLDDVARLGPVVPAFAYPAGQYTPALAALTAECGIQAAFTTDAHRNRVGSTHPMCLGRLNVARRGGLNVARTRALRPGIGPTA
jgi:peptidoglycan/xylan/chitin deacetylase (PgdA/CDA1 family)